MSITIALAGNPNCGKTTLFNALTGATQYVGNWPGVTVEKKEGKLKGLTLSEPQPAMSLDTFSIVFFLIGGAVVGGLQLLRSRLEEPAEG